MRHHDTITGLALLAFCALAYWLTADFDEVPAMLSQNVPPTFFPRLVLTIIAVFSVTLIAQNIRKQRVPAPHIPAAVWVTGGIVAAAGLVSVWAGTLITLGTVAVVLPLAWGERRLRIIAALAVGLPMALYLIFSLGLGVRFPAGRILESLL